MTHQVNDSASLIIKDAEKLSPLKPQEQTRYVIMEWILWHGEMGWHSRGSYSNANNARENVNCYVPHEIHRLKCGGEE